jgi:nucleotide-binding universal stress UspA family protein
MFLPRAPLRLEHISDAARTAYLVARDLAGRAGARVTVMRVIPGHRVPAGAYRDSSEDRRDDLKEWVASVDADGVPEVHVEFGHPSIEIPRYAETQRADLLVLGRTMRSQAARSRVDETADAVIRRSLVPSLLVPLGARAPNRLLVAIDSTARGRLVLDQAHSLARLTGMSCHTVTVEPLEDGDGPVRAGTQRIQDDLRGLIRVRRGSIYQEVLAEIRDSGADLLALGVRRGGPPGLELGSIGRHLAHGVPCAVLAIPL